jgi:membrane-bound lytic murein transglycosylase D
MPTTRQASPRAPHRSALRQRSHTRLIVAFVATALLGACATPGSPTQAVASKPAAPVSKGPAVAAERKVTPAPVAPAAAAPVAVMKAETPATPVAVEESPPPSPGEAATDPAPPLPTLTETSQAPTEAMVAAPAPDLWARIESGFAIADIEHKLVDRHMKWYLDRPDYMRRMIERSQRYLHFVVEELERRKLPTELALLPMIESAYNPLAHSRARAAGMWQFIPSTGKIYGLEQDWWADERRDVVSSTRAALDYLERIYVMHGDWHLALASYNWGEGAVRRAVEKNRRKGLPTSYAYIQMPAETRGYVPKLQAVKNILGNPGLRQMLELPSIPDEPYFVAIERPEEMDVKLAAEFAEISLEEFVALNPAHNRPILRNDVPLLLPRDHVDRFLARVALHDEPFISWQKYVFQKKDRVDKIAKRFGLTEQELRLANGLTGKRRDVKVGQQLMVPLPGKATPETLAVVDALPPFSITDPPPKKRRTYYRKRAKLAALTPAPETRAKPVKKKKTANTRTSRKRGNTRG